MIRKYLIVLSCIASGSVSINAMDVLRGLASGGAQGFGNMVEAIYNNKTLRRAAGDLIDGVGNVATRVNDQRRAWERERAERRQREIERLQQFARYGTPEEKKWAEAQLNRALEEQAERFEAAMRQDEEWANRTANLTMGSLEKAQAFAFEQAGEALNAQRRLDEQVQTAFINAEAQKEASIENTKQYIAAFRDNPKKIVGVIAGTALGVVGSYYLAKFGYEVASSAYGKPTLAQETNMLFGIDAAKALIFGKEELPLPELIFEKNLAERANDILDGLKNCINNGVELGNMLFEGPPGTGKTALCKRLARGCGIYYMYCSASSLIQFSEEEATRQIKELYDFAEKSKHKIVIIWDEADAVFKERSTGTLDSKRLACLNMVLTYTSKASTGHSTIFLTNWASSLDEALRSRCGTKLYVPLPGPNERLAMLKMYVKKYVINAETKPEMPGLLTLDYWKGVKPEGKKLRIEPGVLADSALTSIAHRLDNFSGREIEEMAMQMRKSAYATKDFLLNREMVDKVVVAAVEQNRRDKAGYKRETVAGG